MTTYHLSVMSPDGEVFNDEVISLSLRGADGDLAVFAGHVPLITTVRPGKCVITRADESEIEGELTSGILDVSKDGVKLLIGQKDTFSV
ncbi:MAG: F0F1 ATP synthase subunit epsilon [Clostridiales bacterium]|nr:F0F1 ATP synthase subunit epsilon [Clostridiales bacterium]